MFVKNLETRDKLNNVIKDYTFTSKYTLYINYLFKLIIF